LQLSLFDERDLAEIESPDYPGELLIVCRNEALAAERARKREELLAASEKVLLKIRAATTRARNPLRGAAEIALEVGAVLGGYVRVFVFDGPVSLVSRVSALTRESGRRRRWQTGSLPLSIQ
jgi:hypothetical protein